MRVGPKIRGSRGMIRARAHMRWRSSGVALLQDWFKASPFAAAGAEGRALRLFLRERGAFNEARDIEAQMRLSAEACALMAYERSTFPVADIYRPHGQDIERTAAVAKSSPTTFPR